ncbi:uncharacterized protein LACBIDRAFT_298843 [Laccaria bicolor S238N-H82]|uniref:Predicted protein n=1 Tax=Laccaria bicolor (strain S238N-H82 / ATCC MYA-4686) TaxID=486041 RepID=B0E3J7_LACBS|nr:uncharacterized protein LACBIDRAFT_298843 [Laccaria bicolor S238N-H82]EDQ98584.1 predicted protein [Laccaria bicolor S238N-H82]|eukprot:XP_001890760.1 predicted protein [Laccaria bicolor S238N-H82]
MMASKDASTFSAACESLNVCAFETCAYCISASRQSVPDREPRIVFESPVRSGFLMPRGVNHNRNRSAFSPEVKRPDRTAKRPQTAVFCGL